MCRDRLKILPAGSVRMKGGLGKALRLTIENRLKKINYAHLVDPFRFRNENDGLWRCEFWGKIVRSAILSWYVSPDNELLHIIRKTVNDMLTVQTADGCISSYPVDKQTDAWDIWGRKYVLLGLLRYYNFVEPDECVKKACSRLLDHLMTQVAADKKNIIDCGEHGGLAASSILGAIVGVYRITGDRKYLDYAQWIADTGCSKKHNIFNAARERVPPSETGDGKAYEMMSCFQGLAELHKETPRPEYAESVKAFFEMVRDREIFITGVGGLKDKMGEYWYEGKIKQTDTNSGTLGETCVTTTWIHYCERILSLFGESDVYDELEISFYNGILGAMKPDGTAWVHRNPTPLAGASSKIPADDQIFRMSGIPFDGHDCCLAQGPEALAIAPLLAVMYNNAGLVINNYEEMDVKFRTPDGQSAELNVISDYPRNGQIRIMLFLNKPETFTLHLRIPLWFDAMSSVKICGVIVNAAQGKYLAIKRIWQNEDKIELNFNLNARCVKAPGKSSKVAYMHGPIVLAQDSRLSSIDAPVQVASELNASGPSPEFYIRTKLSNGSILCDYASAGNLFSSDNKLCVFFEWSADGKTSE